MFPYIAALVFALLAAAGWWAFFNQKKVNSALAKVSAVSAAVKAPVAPPKV